MHSAQDKSAAAMTFQYTDHVTSGMNAMAALKMEMQSTTITHICWVRVHMRSAMSSLIGW